MTKKVRPTRNGRAMQAKLKLFLRLSTRVRTPRNRMDVAMNANRGDTIHDKIMETMPCMLQHHAEMVTVLLKRCNRQCL